MNHKLKISLILLFLANTVISYGQTQALTATSRAEVLAELTIELDPANNEIDFGVLPTTTSGIVRLDPNSFSNNIVVNPTTAKVARFDISGQPGAGITVTYDEQVELVDGAEIMVMTSLVVGAGTDAEKETAPAIAQNGPVELSAAEGEFYIWVGGTIEKLTNQAAGEYEGTFNISIAYN